MDEFELRRMIYDYIKEICHFSQMQVFSTSSYQKNYFQLQIDETIGGLINMVFTYNKASMSQINDFQLQQQQQEKQQIHQEQEGQIEDIEPQTESDNVVRIGVLNSSLASPEL